MEWLIRQLGQPSTWRGIALVGSSAGIVTIPDPAVQGIATFISAAIGLWDVFRVGRPFGAPGA